MAKKGQLIQLRKNQNPARYDNPNGKLDRIERQLTRLMRLVGPGGGHAPINPDRNRQVGGGQVRGQQPGKGGSIITPSISEETGDPIWEAGDEPIEAADGPWDIEMSVDALAALQAEYICWLTTHGIPLSVARVFTLTIKINNRATFGGVERVPLDASVPNASVPNQRMRLAEPNGGCAPMLPSVSRLLFRLELAVPEFDPPAGTEIVDPQITITGGSRCDTLASAPC